VGYTGDEIRGGSVGGGKEGFFIQQTIVTAGKLSLARDVIGKEMKLTEIEAEEQRIRVQTAVKMAFIRVLAAQNCSKPVGNWRRSKMTTRRLSAACSIPGRRMIPKF